MTEEKLYKLMEQADSLQEHASMLQNNAENILEMLPLAVKEAAQELKSIRLQSSFYLVAVAIVVSAISIAGIWWGTSSLREEVKDLRGTLAVLEEQVSDAQRRAEVFIKKAGKVDLTACGDEKRLCVRIDEKAGKFGNGKELYMILYGY